MIVLFKSYGSHSNRLFQNLHFEAFCLEQDIPYANATFTDLSTFYQSPVKVLDDSWAKLMQLKIFQPLIDRRLFKNVIYFPEEQDLALSTLLANDLKNRDAYYVGGWGFRVHYLTEKYQDLFIQKYALKPEFYSNNPLLLEISTIERQTTAVIGVHVRRGDYKTWNGGKYFFPDEVYQKYMLALAAQIQDHEQRNCFFMIFSNEVTSFTESKTIRVSQNPWYLDHLLMSKCDYLIGPPSTFTLWASYMGKTKFFHIKNTSGQIAMDQFKYCIG